jgi:hypothetical protein
VCTFHQVLGIVNVRDEGGLTLEDTTYATTSPLFLPYRQALATADLGVVAPIITTQDFLKRAGHGYSF